MDVLLCLPNSIFDFHVKATFIYRFNARDTRGSQAPTHVVKIRFCRCNSATNGICDFNQVIAGTDEGSLFQIVECECATGWTGIFKPKLNMWGYHICVPFLKKYMFLVHVQFIETLCVKVIGLLVSFPSFGSV